MARWIGPGNLVSIVCQPVVVQLSRGRLDDEPAIMKKSEDLEMSRTESRNSTAYDTTAPLLAALLR